MTGPNIMSSITFGMNIWLSGSCRTYPTFLRISARFSLFTARPPTVIVPDACRRPGTHFRRVLFPAPLAPMSPTFSPSLTSKVTPSRAGALPGYENVTLSNLSMSFPQKNRDVMNAGILMYLAVITATQVISAASQESLLLCLPAA